MGNVTKVTGFWNTVKLCGLVLGACIIYNIKWVLLMLLVVAYILN